MKRLKITAIILCALTVILEILPFGAVLNFMSAPDDPVGHIRKTYSYFSLTPIGYANFGPFLCALLSVVLLVYHIICGSFIVKKNAYAGAIALNLIAIVFSITPLMFGIDYYSVVGLLISISLSALYIVTYLIGKKNNA